MNNGLSGIKNIIWALAIVLVLAVVLVGLIITMVLGFSGQRQDGTLYLGEGSGLSSGGSAGTSAGSGGVDGGLDGSAGAMALPILLTSGFRMPTIWAVPWLRPLWRP